MRLLAGGRTIAAATRRIGFRRLAAQGEQLLLNGDPICLRGALSWGWNPAVIAPCYTADQARAELRTLRAMGFNLVKLCLFIPNQVYYDVADEEGMLLWQEWPLWLPEVTAELRARAPGEYAEYMQLTRSHPSVVVYSLGCELDSSVDRVAASGAGRRRAWQPSTTCSSATTAVPAKPMAAWPRTLPTSPTITPTAICTISNRSSTIGAATGSDPAPGSLASSAIQTVFATAPVCSPPTAGQVPWWLTADNPASIWRPEMQAVLDYDARMAAAFALGAPDHDLHAIAAAQSLMVRKYTLEAVRKRRSVQGYVITGLIDTPIATSGVLDDFGAPKWDPGVFRRCNDDAILCLDTGRSRIWQHGGDRPQRLDVYNWWAGAPIQLYVILNHTKPQPIAVRRGNLADRGAGWRHRWAAAVGKSPELLPPSFPCELGHIVLPAPPQRGAAKCHAPRRGRLLAALCCAATSGRCGSYPRPQFDPSAALLYDPIGALDAEWCTLCDPHLHEDLLGRRCAACCDRHGAGRSGAPAAAARRSCPAAADGRGAAPQPAAPLLA